MHAHCACTARMMNSRSMHTHDSCVCSEVPPGHLHEPVLDRRAALAFRPVSNVSGKEGPRGGEASGGLGLCISIHTYIRTYIHFGSRRRDRRVPFALSSTPPSTAHRGRKGDPGCGRGPAGASAPDLRVHIECLLHWPTRASILVCHPREKRRVGCARTLRMHGTHDEQQKYAHA